MSDTSSLPEWATVALGGGMTHSRYAKHIRIEQPSNSIKGRYTIGPAAHDHRPPLYDMPLETVVQQASSSASFETKGSAIAIEVWIVGDERDPGHETTDRRRASVDEQAAAATNGSDKGAMVQQPKKNKPVSVAAKSYMGRIEMSIPRYTPSRPLHLRAKSHHGSIHIHLPASFSGLISWRTESGTLKLSPAIQARYIEVGEVGKRRGTGMIIGKDQPPPAGHIVGRVKDAAKKRGLATGKHAGHAESGVGESHSEKGGRKSKDGKKSRPPTPTPGTPNRKFISLNAPSDSPESAASRAPSSTTHSGQTSPTASSSHHASHASGDFTTSSARPTHSRTGSSKSISNLSMTDYGLSGTSAPGSTTTSGAASPVTSTAAGGGSLGSTQDLGLPGKAAAMAASVSGSATRGDACELITTNGTIYISEVGEKSTTSAIADSCIVM